MSIEFLEQLENKIDNLIETIKNVREENNRLKLELEQANGKVGGIEHENQQMRTELASMQNDSQGRQDKLNAATQKIQSLLAKLETV